MVEYSYLFFLLCLIPVVLQIIIPLFMLCGWGVAKVPMLMNGKKVAEIEKEPAFAH